MTTDKRLTYGIGHLAGGWLGLDGRLSPARAEPALEAGGGKKMNRKCITCGVSVTEEGMVGGRCGRCDKLVWDAGEDGRMGMEGLA
jgi:hypothetical protein